MLGAFTIYSGCSRLSQLDLLGLRNRVKKNRDGDFKENYGKESSASSWPGWSRRDTNNTDKKRILEKK